jgi:hypothetical protein
MPASQPAKRLTESNFNGTCIFKPKLRAVQIHTTHLLLAAEWNGVSGKKVGANGMAKSKTQHPTTKASSSGSVASPFLPHSCRDQQLLLCAAAMFILLPMHPPAGLRHSSRFFPANQPTD